MKKRYLSMLMAVVLCLTLCTGAFAASGEIETAASEEITEPVADGQPSETPAESAEPGETPQTQALDGESAGVPVPMALSSDGEGNANPSTLFPPPADGTTIEGYAIAGFGGTVTYGDLRGSSAPDMQRDSDYNFENYFQWEGDNKSNIETNATVNGSREKYGMSNHISDIKISVKAEAGAENYAFSINKDNKMGLTKYTGTLVVLSLADARKYPDVVKYEGFDFYKYTGTAASPTPLAGAVFGLYTSDPSTETTATPVATFRTDENGAAKITLDKNTAENVLPALGDPTKNGTERGGTNYYLKEITAPDGYALSTTVWSVFGYAEWETKTNGATTSLKFILEHPTDSAWNATESRFEVSNQPLPNEYEGFDLVAWTKKDVTETGAYTVEPLANVKFGVYAVDPRTDAAATPVASYTTDSYGTVYISPENFEDACPGVGEDPKTFYLKQTGGQTTTEHGTRPVADAVWEFEASASRSSEEGKYIRFELALPVGDENSIGQQKLENNKWEFWVFNDYYARVSFDFEKTVSVKNEGMDPGDNVFNFLLAFASPVNTWPTISFKSGDGEATALSQYTEVADARVYTLTLPVSGAGTAKGTVSIEGWSRALEGDVALYEAGEAPADWEYADYMYTLALPTDEGGGKLVYDGAKLGVYRVDAQKNVSDDDKTLQPGELGQTTYCGHDGKWYAGTETTYTGTASFVNTYTKAPAPVPTATPAPTPAPTATPEAAKAVKTGDEANLALWLALATLSALGLGYVCRKKKEN